MKSGTSESVMVNFRLAEDRLAAVRTQAARRRVSVSAYVRLCVEAGIERDEAAARDDIAWQREVPAAVRELIGLGGSAPVDDAAARDEYHDYLAEKYA